MPKCPGQDQRFWKPDDIFDIECSSCGALVEFWKDEPKLKCPKCKNQLVNPKLDPGCAEWCKYAKECLGGLGSPDDSILCDNLVKEMKNIFADDQKRINHALSVLKYAEQLQAIESGDPLVIKAAAVLHDIGIPQAQIKHGSAAGKFQEIEGPAIAEKILAKYGVEAELIEHICKIIANHHSAKDIDTTEFRIIWDADWLINFPEEFPDANKEKAKEMLEKIFKTQQGRKLAYKLFTNS